MNRKDQKEQIEALLKQMTLEEKTDLIHGSGFFRTKGVERLGIPGVVSSDGPMGVRMQFPDDSWVPVGDSDDYVTYNPSNSALAATWNPELAYESGKVLGEEARGRGKDVILAPGINIKRDPRCGRNFEYMSEDPYLNGTLAVPFIKGVQECDVAACVKHFAVNNQETDRLAIDTYVDERALREIYLPAFKAAVQEGGSYSIMNAYNQFRGHFCSESKELLDDILRDEWKYDGAVISDWGSTHSTKGVAECSMDMEMSITTDFDAYYLANPLREAVRKGEISEACVDAKVRNILRMMFRLKMLGEQAPNRKQGAYNAPEHRQSTYQVAKESIVLLKNEPAGTAGERLLPLTAETLAMKPIMGNDGSVISVKKHRIVVIGDNAERIHAAGGGSAEIKALYEISPLLGLKMALGGNVDIAYAPGYYVPEPKTKVEDLVNWQEKSLEQRVMSDDTPDTEEKKALRREIEANRAKLRKEACELAQTADTVIFVGGLNHYYDIESRDRADMKLPYAQDELIAELLKIRPDTIVVMVGGSPVEMPWAAQAKALVWCYYSGMETGNALADVLLGRVNPSAKLPETFPVAYTDTVTYKNGEFGNEGRVEYKEGIFVGYRYYEKEGIKPAFPFGYGLSYTQFSIEDLQVLSAPDASWAITVNVKNTGNMAGAEVVQCYISDPVCSVERPVKELNAYQKVFLQPGEEKQVTIPLTERGFVYYDVERKAFVTEPGEYVVSVGNASDNCLLQECIVL
ncbi:MAG: glycoside hydrolase family 3 C-terminal domain-containing protein [Lachnospiraceae bacterium]|nr:glycoside hydrolase family 3 C-terminal domain-containing protein [Lachnospiraceae bacterium]